MKILRLCVFSFFLLFVSLSAIFAQSDSDYIVKYFVDEFGDLTDHKYLQAVVTGKFSNSATKDSSLLVSVLIADNEISFQLYEYGNNQVIGSDYAKYAIKMKFPDGYIYEGITKIDPYTSRLDISEILDSSIDFKTMFSGISPVKVYIYELDRPYTNYLFSVTFPSMAYIIKNLGSEILWLPY